MQMCLECDNVYDESEYNRCLYCSGELKEETEPEYYKVCPNCGGTMFWNGYEWYCYDCCETIETDEDDYDGLLNSIILN